MPAKLRTAAHTEFSHTGWGRAAWAAAVLAVIAAIALAADTLGWIVRAYSPLPFWDQWDVVADVAKIKAGTFEAGNLIAQHGEHRILFPRLIFYADLLLGRGQGIVNLGAIAIIQLLHAVLLIRMLGPLRRPGLVVAAAVVAALLAFLGQWENLVWGFQVQFVAVYLLATAGYLLLARAVQARGGARLTAFAGGCGCLIVAVFCMANGLAALSLAVPLALALRAPRWMIGALAGLTALAAALYLRDYTPVSEHSTLAYALAHPLDYLPYVANYAGNIAGLLAHRPPTAAFHAPLATAPLLLGVAGLSLAAGALIREGKGGFADPTGAVLLAIMTFVLASAALTALGRLNFGVDQALASRYQTPGAVFWAAQIIYWTRAAGQDRARAIVAASALLGLLIWSQVRLAPELEAHAARMRAAEDSLISRVRDDAAIGGVNVRPGEAWERAAILDRYNLSIFAEPEADWPGRELNTLTKVAPTGACIGAFDALSVPLTNAPANAVSAGWAWDVTHHSLPRRIVMTDARGIVVGVGHTGAKRPDVAAARPEVTSPAAGWTGFVHVDGGEVTAFALLADGTACALGARPGLPRG
jgi:hypothetical protein